MNYSKNFERDYNWYLKYKNEFRFCGTKVPRHIAIPDKEGYSAKEVFYSIDSQGKNIKCKEPELLNSLLLCKASINFHIKALWADGIKEGSTKAFELIDEFELLDWMVESLKNQVMKSESRYISNELD
jgi:hypothetical protein